jgi:hypothetical protein
MAASILDLFNVPRELTLEFLATFARFEFALKKASYAQGDNSKVSPDWDTFAKDVAKIDAAVLAPELNGANTCSNIPPKSKSCRTVRCTGSCGEELRVLRLGMCY